MRQDHPSIALMYHRIGSPLVRSIVRGQYVTPSLFRGQLVSLLGQGYQPITLAGMLDGGKFSGHLSVTFDDGYAAVHRLAYLILAEMGITATVYVVAGAVGKSNEWDQLIGDRVEPMLTADEIRELARAGFEIGSHTISHAHLTTLSDADLRAEVTDSKKMLEDIIGGPVTGFSYPYGEWDVRVRDAAIEAGYSYAASTIKGVVTPSVDRFTIPRINVRWNNLPSVLMRKIRKCAR